MQKIIFCFCGRIGEERFMDKCERHRLKEAPKKKIASPKFRGDSKWQRNQQMFNNKEE